MTLEQIEHKVTVQTMYGLHSSLDKILEGMLEDLQKSPDANTSLEWAKNYVRNIQAKIAGFDERSKKSIEGAWQKDQDQLAYEHGDHA